MGVLNIKSSCQKHFAGIPIAEQTILKTTGNITEEKDYAILKSFVVWDERKLKGV